MNTFRIKYSLILVFVTLSCATSSQINFPDRKPGGSPNFIENTHDGGKFELYNQAKEIKAIVLISYRSGCPIVQRYTPVVKAISDKFAPLGVKFYYINSSTEDEIVDITASAKEFGINIPILLDQSQIGRRIFHFSRTAEAVLIDTRSAKVLYQGAIDDRQHYDGAKNIGTDYLTNALNEFLRGEPVQLARTEPRGCIISNGSLPEQAFYHQDVAPILQKKCLSCHNQSGNPPKALNQYREAKFWSEKIGMKMRMQHSDISEDDRGILATWVASGSQEGALPAETSGRGL